MTHKRINLVTYFLKNISVILGVVFIWRGIWYILDIIDAWLFDGGHIWTAVGGIIIGLAILYIPDHDLKELQKL